MLRQRPCPRAIVWLIRFCQGDLAAIEGACLGAAAGLAGMMAIGALAAWHAGLL